MIFYILLLSSIAFADINYISPDDLASCALDGQREFFSKPDLCEEKKGVRCLALDSDTDCKIVDLIDGELIPNPDKKFARELKEKSDLDAEKAKQDARKLARERLKAADPDRARTIADLKAMIKDLLEAVKE